MKILSILLLAFTLISCGGGGDALVSQSQEPQFSREELTNSILVSEAVLEHDFVNSRVPEGSIVLFNSTDMREISLTEITRGRFIDGNAEYTEQPWTILSDGRIQISYPQDISCFTKKEKEIAPNSIDISGECTNNLQMTDTVLQPLEFNTSFLHGKKITTIFEGTTEIFDFRNDGTFDLDVTFHGPLGSGT